MTNTFRMAIVLLLLSASQACQGQWITTFYSHESPRDLPISGIPWSKITLLVDLGAAVNVDCTIDVSHLVTPTTTTAAAHAAGKVVSFSIFGPATSIATCAAAVNRTKFVANLVEVMKIYGYDGVDLDWESSVNSSNYQGLIDDLYAAINPSGKLITIEVNGAAQLISVAAAKYAKLGQINVFGYDSMDCCGYDVSLYNSPILGSAYGGSVQSRMALYTAAGVPPAKLGIGIPAYARQWSSCTKVLQAGCTKDRAYLRYSQVLANTECMADSHYDATYQSNWCRIASTNKWVPYSGTEFVRDVVSFMRSGGYGGIQLFALDYQYVPSGAGDAKNPLVTNLYNAISGPARRTR